MTQNYTKHELLVILITLKNDKKIAETDLFRQELIEDVDAIKLTKNRIAEDEDLIAKTNVFIYQDNNMKKSDLKPGMIVVTRDCEYYTVTNGKLENRTFYVPLNRYNDDMLMIGDEEGARDADIMKVYDSTFKGLLFERKE